MTVSIYIASTLRTYVRESRAELTSSAATVQEALDQLKREHASLYRSVCDETGAVRRHVHLFVNDDFIHDRAGLETQLAPGDVLAIMPAVSGG